MGLAIEVVYALLASVRREHGRAIREVLAGMEPSDQPPMAGRSQDGGGIPAGRRSGHPHVVRPVSQFVVGSWFRDC